MPSQICHILFADECLHLALGTDDVARLAPRRALLLFGAQGPDFFFHNGFRKPSGRTFGALLHRRSMGRLASFMAARLAQDADDDLLAYLLGFVSHPFLDRFAHPFIDYFAGWEDPERPETAKYYRCHAFFERIVDTVFLRERLGVAAESYPVPAMLDCGPDLPAVVTGALGDGLRATFPGLDMTADAETRVSNAYRDCLGFYRYTSDPELRREAARQDRKGPYRRRLALFHPPDLPADLDFLNASHRRWVHPCDESRASTASFADLYAQAMGPAVEAMTAVAAVARGGPASRVEEAVGNSSLNTESPATGRRRFCAPLPLPELLEEQYRRAE